ncbi:hypothetical protein [Sandaracinus amylolyticus]|uniref:hypothetical protein n=1 Tax=Sandaracinus amylolyticus TaxID=927083 RepID=UPI001F3500A0|nr:hypothetical protein [Sandaracinus amylolyticus]UJR82386.1 Hypothetical protein I5071_44510 [Sandaracinus amylolyticus]
MIEGALRALAWRSAADAETIDSAALDDALVQVRTEWSATLDARVLAILETTRPSEPELPRSSSDAIVEVPDEPVEIPEIPPRAAADVAPEPPPDPTPSAMREVRVRRTTDRASQDLWERLGSFIPPLAPDATPPTLVEAREPVAPLRDPLREWKLEIERNAALMGVITRIALLDLVPRGIFGVHDPTFAIVIVISDWTFCERVVEHLAEIDAPGGMPTECVVLGRVAPREAIERGEFHVTRGIESLRAEWRRGLVEGAIERAWRAPPIYTWRRRTTPFDLATGFVTFTPMRIRCTGCDRCYLIPHGTSLRGVACLCGREDELVSYETDPVPRVATPREVECARCSWRFFQAAPTPDDVCPKCRHFVIIEP